MEVIAEIRRRHLVSGESISAIARDLKLSRPTVRKHLQTESEAVYLREHQPSPKLGAFRSVLESWLTLLGGVPPSGVRAEGVGFAMVALQGHHGGRDQEVIGELR